jgi:hypothetical protein
MIATTIMARSLNALQTIYGQRSCFAFLCETEHFGRGIVIESEFLLFKFGTPTVMVHISLNNASTSILTSIMLSRMSLHLLWFRCDGV